MEIAGIPFACAFRGYYDFWTSFNLKMHACAFQSGVSCVSNAKPGNKGAAKGQELANGGFRKEALWTRSKTQWVMDRNTFIFQTTCSRVCSGSQCSINLALHKSGVTRVCIPSGQTWISSANSSPPHVPPCHRGSSFRHSLHTFNCTAGPWAATPPEQYKLQQRRPNQQQQRM